MSFTTKTVKMVVGMRKSYWAPIVNEPANAAPEYGEVIDMGAARKAYIAVTTAAADVPGDDIVQVHFEQFVSGTLDTETDCSDVELNATVYGHAFEDGVEISGGDDSAPNGGYAYYEPLMLKDKSMIFRATFLPKITAVPASEKQEADTKQPGQLDPKVNAVQYQIMADNTKRWRYRKEFNSEADAEAWLMDMFGSTAAWPVEITHIGSGSSTPGAGVTYVAAGENLVIDFGTSDPVALYDNGVDKESSITSHKYTISAIAAPHRIVAVWSA